MKSDYSVFNAKYAKLNPQQRQAVDTIDGSVAVYAGPGTGKTQILTLRIANIVRLTDTPADAVLALTFTESACANMRTRLSEIMGSSAYEVNIHTFHGFASRIINSYPEHFLRIYDSRLAHDADLLQLSTDLLNAHIGKHLKLFSGDRNPHVTSLLSAIDQLKREHISPDMLQHCVENEQSAFDAIPDKIHTKGQYIGKMRSEFRTQLDQIEENRELVELYGSFELEMRNRKLYTFTDMLTELVSVMESNTDFCMQLQEQYQYILVDEYQDTNGIQNRIVELLADFFDNPNIFVVGDDKQSIYRFQGASPHFFYGFQKKYPLAVTINLESNYRSHQSVLQLADTVLPGNVVLQSGKTHTQSARIELSSYPDNTIELYSIIHSIQKLIFADVNPSEIAVLVRKNSQIAQLVQFCFRAGIQCHVDTDTDINDSRIAAECVDVIRLISDIHNNELMGRVLYGKQFNLPVVEVSRIVRSGYHKRKISIIDILLDEKLLREIGVAKPSVFVAFAQRIIEWHSKSITAAALELFTDVVQNTLPLHFQNSVEIVRDMPFIETLFKDIEQFSHTHRNATLSEYVFYLDTLEQFNKGLSAQVYSNSTKAIHIMTAHKSKGLEFEHVFIPHMVDGVWGGNRNRLGVNILASVFDSLQNDDSEHDERRLFYVALTRAKMGIHMSYSNSNSANDKALVPSKFISEILSYEHTLVRDTSNDIAEYELGYVQSIIKPATPTSNAKDTFHDFVLEMLDRRPLSATHLNNYLDDPWLYIIRNIIRFPEIQGESAMFGTAMHAGVEQLYKHFAEHKIASNDIMYDYFEHELLRQPLSIEAQTRLLHRGRESIDNWYYNSTQRAPWDSVGYSELNVNGVTIPRCGFVLSGKIDRLEHIDTSDGFRVIDFKTGIPKSRNDIIGATKTSDGKYYRQLQFYAILMRYYKNGMYDTVRESVIEFLEPNKTGKFVREVFVIPSDEVDELEQTVRRVESEIKSAVYFDSEPDSIKCKQYLELINRIRN